MQELIHIGSNRHHRMSLRRRAGVLAVALTGSIALPGPAAAADLTWVAGDGNWENAANWSDGRLPTDQDFAEIGAQVNVTSSATDNIAAEFLSHAALSIDAGLLTIVGTLDTFGIVTVGPGAMLDAGRIFTQATGGLTVTGANSSVDVIEGVFSSGEVVLDGGASLRAESFDNLNQWSIAGGARAQANSMINHPTALLSVADATSRLVINGDLTNNGRLEAVGAEVIIDSIDNFGALAYSAAAKVSGDSIISHGDIDVRGNATNWSLTFLTVENGSTTIADEASANIGTLVNGTQVSIDAATLGGDDIKNDVGGQLAVTGGSIVSAADEVLNWGTLYIDATSRISGSSFLQLAGTTTLGGGTLAATNALGASIAAGALAGFGAIESDIYIVTDGILTPGIDSADPTARFDISGKLLLAGEYIVEIGGLAAADFDHVVAGGTVSVGGRLTVSALNSYQAAIGDFFDIIVGNQVSGEFTTLDLPTLGGGLKFDAFSGDGFYRLAVTAVPVPTVLPFFALFAALTASWSRYRGTLPS